jgi:hypothetical protein
MNEQPTIKRNRVKHALNSRGASARILTESAGHSPQTSPREATSNAASIGARKRSGANQHLDIAAQIEASEIAFTATGSQAISKDE